MVTSLRALGLAALACLLSAGEARAQADGDAADAGGDPGASAITSPASNALTLIRRSEPRTEVALGLGSAVSERPDRIGAGGRLEPSASGLARGALELEGSWAPSRRWELFVTVNALAYRWLLVGAEGQPTTTGGKDFQELSFGSTTIGATWVPVSLPGGLLDGGAFVRVLLPTSTEIPGAHVWGVQAGATFRGVATRWLAWFGGASLRVGQSWGTVTVPLYGQFRADGTQTGMSGALGLVFVPSSWFRLVLQCSGNVPFSAAGKQVSPGMALRFVNGPLSADIGLSRPLLGTAHSFGTMARVSWRLD